MPGEFDFIQWIRSQTPPDARVVIPPGDDLAALRWAGDDLLIVGADQVLDGVHFDSSVHSPVEIGRKAMNRNLSDCAAMACLPVAAVATVALPRGSSVDRAKQLFLGLRDAAARYDCAIVGGDTGSWDGKLVLSVTVLGRSAGVEPVRRSGAKPGDLIGVTGPLGGSILGRHMSFEPRVREARALLAVFDIHAMIDLSDGLSRDLRHVCRESNVGAVIDAAKLPIHDDAIEMRRDGHSPLEHALHDGEDYELLVAGRVRPGARGDLGNDEILRCTSPAGVDVDLTFIGVITPDPGIFLRHHDGRVEPLEPKAWEHRF